MTRVLNDAIVAVKQQFPPGDENLYSWDDPHAWVTADLREKSRAVLAMWAQQDKLRRELVPQTADEKLSDWEAIFGAPSGNATVTMRQAAIVARWRESGASTLDNITAAIASLAGSAAAVTIVEHSRTSLRNQHTYSFSTITATVGNTANVTLAIGENAVAARMGAQLLLNVSTGDQGDFLVTLVAPDAQEFTPSLVYVDGADHVYFWPEFAGLRIDGTWAISVDNTGAGTTDVQVDTANLFVEGIGIGPFGGEGLAGNVFEFCVLVTESTVNAATWDRLRARSLIQHWKPGHTRGYLCLTGVGDGVTATAGIWGDPTNSCWDGFIWE